MLQPLLPSDAARALIIASVRAKTYRALGGVGSGNFGHEGRPGEIGGSTATSGILDAIQKADGGFTYNPLTGHSPTSGYALSLHKDRERVLNEMSLVHLAQYAKDNNDLLSAADNYLGGWHNPEDGKFYLDVSTVVKNPSDAERLGREHHQLAYFDLSKGQSVPIEHHHVKAASTFYRGRLEDRANTRRSYRVGAQDDGARTDARRSGRSTQGARGLGGAGSGNFGHAGRKGEVGGSGGGLEGDQEVLTSQEQLSHSDRRWQVSLDCIISPRWQGGHPLARRDVSPYDRTGEK